jgi:hypothetical protein
MTANIISLSLPMTFSIDENIYDDWYFIEKEDEFLQPSWQWAKARVRTCPCQLEQVSVGKIPVDHSMHCRCFVHIMDDVSRR